MANITEEKKSALRKYVAEAINERDNPYSIGESQAPEFESNLVQSYWIDSLEKALRNTDALDVLADMLGLEVGTR